MCVGGLVGPNCSKNVCCSCPSTTTTTGRSVCVFACVQDYYVNLNSSDSGGRDYERGSTKLKMWVMFGCAKQRERYICFVMADIWKYNFFVNARVCMSVRVRRVTFYVDILMVFCCCRQHTYFTPRYSHIQLIVVDMGGKIIYHYDSMKGCGERCVFEAGST